MGVTGRRLIRGICRYSNEWLMAWIKVIASRGESPSQSTIYTMLFIFPVMFLGSKASSFKNYPPSPFGGLEFKYYYNTKMHILGYFIRERGRKERAGK